MRLLSEPAPKSFLIGLVEQEPGRVKTQVETDSFCKDIR